MTSVTTVTTERGDVAREHPTGMMRWIMTTNHKDIAFMYMAFSGAMFFIAGLLAMIFRAELAVPGVQFLNGAVYNQLVTLHGLTMVFAFIMPFAIGLSNYLIPLMIGAPGMALPRLSKLAFWLLPLAVAMLLVPFFLQFFGIGDGASQSAWTMDNTGLDMQSRTGIDFTIIAVYLFGISSIASAFNIIVTVLRLRTAKMTLWEMPLFCWGWLVVSFLLLLVVPVLATAMTMLLTDRHFGTHFFITAGGGDPILFQHLFWFFGHPEVYIVVLPAWAILPTILATFARKPIYGYKAQVYSYWAIAFLGSIVWGHHMLAQGLPLAQDFMYATFSISVPTAVLIFCWIGTIWRGAMTFETPMLFALGAIVGMLIGGLSGFVIPDVAAYAQYHNTMYIVGHFHYPFFGAAVLGIMAMVYYYLPKMTGRMYNERLGRWHFWVTTVAFNMTFLPIMLVGLAGMPRHVVDYALTYANWNWIASLAAFVLGAAQLIFLYNIIQTVRGRGEPVSDRPWEGAVGLEWTLSSPPPYHSFTPPSSATSARAE